MGESPPRALANPARPDPPELPPGLLAEPPVLMRLAEVGREAVGAATALSFSLLVTRPAKVVMEQRQEAPPDPRHLALPPRPNARAWVDQQPPMPQARLLGLVELGARPIPPASLRGFWDPRPMGRVLEVGKHRT